MSVEVILLKNKIYVPAMLLHIRPKNILNMYKLSNIYKYNIYLK